MYFTHTHRHGSKNDIPLWFADGIINSFTPNSNQLCRVVHRHCCSASAVSFARCVFLPDNGETKIHRYRHITRACIYIHFFFNFAAPPPAAYTQRSYIICTRFRRAQPDPENRNYRNLLFYTGWLFFLSWTGHPLPIFQNCISAVFYSPINHPRDVFKCYISHS